MIRLARERSTQFPNIDFQLADICDQTLPDESFDCIASIATLHHLPYAEMLLKMKAALKPGGVLLILDLFEPARISDSPAAGLLDSPAASLWDSLAAGLSDSLLNFVAFPVSVALRFKHYGRLRRLRQSPEERAAWAAHEHHDLYPTMHAVRTLCASILPCAKIKQHLLWRYSIVWQKPI
jgi:SAM-dependent methyltransferase